MKTFQDHHSSTTAYKMIWSRVGFVLHQKSVINPEKSFSKRNMNLKVVSKEIYHHEITVGL